MSRKHFSAEVKREAVDLVVNSKLSIAEVAQQVECSVNTLHSWLRKYRLTQPDAATLPIFVPVTLVDPKTDTIEIITPNGYTIRLPYASPKYIAELLHAISPC
jgi:transposase-like protein